MEYNVLKQSIAAVIKANGNEEITGDLLQQVLIAMVDVLGAGYQFAGLAVPTTNPGTPDAKMFYIATQAGTYSNFGSPAPVLTGEQVAILRFSTSWTAVVLDIPTKAYVDNALSGKVDKVEGKSLSTNDLTNELVTLINGAFQKANITDELGTDETKVLSQAAITTVLLQYAKVDGYYSSLTAGAAENLVGRGSVPASFLRRTTGGTADVGTGSAKIAKLMGNSIVWNQLAKRSFSSSEQNGVTVSADTDNNAIALSGTPSNYSVNGYILPSFIVGHKYFYSHRIISNPNNLTIKIGLANQGNVAQSTDADFSAIFESSATGNGWGYTGGAMESALDGIKVRVNAIDLTKMFGAGKEPSTVADFKAIFPLDYYADESGKVLPFAAQKLVTTGFNQWDEQWEVGSLSSGNNTADPDKIRSKNYIPVFGGQTYYFKAPVILFVHYYNSAKECISASSYPNGYTVRNNTLTLPSDVAFIRFRTLSGTTYNHDICVNLSWSGYRNGEYEPFELHEAIFDPANWEDADGNKIFPYGGMHGVGTARDFATPDNDGFIRKGTRVFARVDLGSFDWEKNDNGWFQTAQNTIVGVKGDTLNLLTTIDVIPSVFSSATNTTGTPKIGVNTNERVRISFGDNYSTLTEAQFKTAMSGVYLVYELAETVEIELAEPVAASYYANDFGTEEWQPANDDEPYTAPCEMQIAYAMNAVDTLRRLPENYISVGSFENFCTELATKLGAALNKNITITPTYDSENAEYDYSITIADIEG